jgi:preprotein translocase subunit Sec61beta
MISMAEKRRMQAPSGMAGLVKYEDEGESLIKMKPIHVVGIGVALILLELILFLAIPF